MARDLSPLLPQTVELHPTPYPCGTASWGDVPGDLAVPLDLGDLDLPVATGTPTTLALRDSCPAIYPAPGGGDPSNLAALQALARLVARDRLGPLLVAYDRAHAGIVAPAPDATVGAIAWTYRAGGASTRMATEPTGGEPTRLGHDDAAADCDGRPLVYGGTDRATLASGTLKLPRLRLDVVDGSLRWFEADPQSLVICPQS